MLKIIMLIILFNLLIMKLLDGNGNYKQNYFYIFAKNTMNY